MTNEEIKKRISAMIIMIGVVILVSIIAIIIIWQPKKIEKEEIPLEIGQFRNVNVSINYTEKYITEILGLFKSGNIDKLYDLLLPSYKEKKKITKAKLESMLIEKKLWKKEFTDYTYINRNNSKKRYISLNVKNIASLTEETIIISEISPNNYNITLDNYIYESGDFKQEFLERKLYIKLYDIKYGVELYSAKVEIKNTSDKKIVLNKDPNKEVIAIQPFSGRKILSSTSFAAGRTITLSPGETINFPVLFSIPAFSHNSVYSLIINSVYDEESKKEDDIVVKIAHVI